MFSEVFLFLFGVITTALVGWIVVKRVKHSAEESFREKIRLIRRESDVELQEAKSKLELDFEKEQVRLSQEISKRQLELESREHEATASWLKVEKERELIEQRRVGLDQQWSQISERENTVRIQAEGYREKLAAVTDISLENAKRELLREVEVDCSDEARALRESILNRSELEIQSESRNILIACMQRLASKPQHDITATIVKLPSDDIKGRIIGREGRNIKAFESTTGTTLLIDETPDSVLISSFDPVRREVARIALEALMRDGRIHPSSIEESVAEAEEEVKASVIGFGEDALRRLRLGKVHPEIVGLLGRMHYRLANNQNSLDHSIEVSNLAGLMAAELGLDVELAKRSGLFHDIGKVLDEEYEGSHAVAGANYLKRYGNEDPKVINAIAGHHEEVPAESPYVAIVMMADSLSAMRPGARAENIDSYIQRVRNLEAIAKECEGVQDVYALQAGREIRVVVSPSKVDDQRARLIAKQIRRKIEDELQYPGTIRVTVIRESRITEVAK